MEVYENLTKPLIDFYSSINYINKDQNDQNENSESNLKNPSFLSFEFKNGVKDYPILKSEIDDLFS